jgi:hypothetical protein
MNKKTEQPTWIKGWRRAVAMLFAYSMLLVFPQPLFGHVRQYH